MIKKLCTALLLVFSIIAIPMLPAKDTGYSGLVWAADSLWSYRSQLNEQEAYLYDAMSENFIAGNATFTYTFPKALEFDSQQKAQDGIRDMSFRAYEAFYRDHPQVFWINKNLAISLEGAKHNDKTMVSSVDITVSFSSLTDLSGKQTTLENKVQEILKDAGSSDFDKVRTFHDYLTENCSYDEAAAATPKSYPLSYESYGALIYGNATCEGYSKAFKLLCDKAGIPCIIVGGNAGGESHMWNYVQVEGAWYLVDATFDDPIGGLPRYDYFLKGTGSTPEYQNQGSFTQNFDPRFTDPTLSQADYSLPDMSKPILLSENNSISEPSQNQGPCRVFYTRTGNGTVSIQFMHSSGSLDSGQMVPYDVVLKVVAFPENGYELDSLSIDMGGVIATSTKRVTYLSVTSDCSISAVFKKV